MNPTLPFDIIAVILLMLPVETLARFQCVCRTWKHLIRDPIFIRKHLQNRASKGNRYLLYVPLGDTIDRAFRLLCDETFEQALEIKLPFELLDIRFIVIGSFNGLLCLTDANRFGTTIYLCNPFIRKIKTINLPKYDFGSSKQSDITFSLGFGYSDVTNDYKIVRIASPLDEDSVPSFQYDAMKNRIGVYSMISNSWKNLKVDYFPWGMFELKSEAFLNESIHWKAAYRSRRGDISVIVAFHMGKEVFYQIDLPDYKVDGNDVMESIGVFKGDLALFCFGLINRYPWHDRCHLWVMKEYGVVSSWTKLYSIALDIGVVSPIVFTKDGEVIFEDNQHHLCMYRPDSNAVKVIGAEDQGYLNFVSYIDSLVMLDG